MPVALAVKMVNICYLRNIKPRSSGTLIELNSLQNKRLSARHFLIYKEIDSRNSLYFFKPAEYIEWPTKSKSLADVYEGL